MQPLAVGSRAPDISLPDQTGQMLSLHELLKEGPVVLYFYPKDFTPVCTKESCGFRDVHDEFVGKDARVIGVSTDSVESHKSFAERYQLPFPLLADRKGVAHDAFGVRRGLLANRVTFVIAKDGTIQNVTSARLRASPHVKDALQAVEELL